MYICGIEKKNERIVTIFENVMTKFHELPEQPSYLIGQVTHRILLAILNASCFATDESRYLLDPQNRANA